MINEKDCVVEHKGKTFVANGARLDDLGGVVYISEDTKVIPTRFKATTWHGDFIAWVTLNKEWKQNSLHKGRFTMRSIRFKYNDKTYWGRYGSDWAQSCNVKVKR